MKRNIGTALVVGLFIAAPASADSVRNLSIAGGDSSEAAARVSAAGGQVAIGAVAVPLAAVGTIAETAGGAANDIAIDLWDAANTPLVVDRDIVIAQPAPDLSVQRQAGEQ